MILSYTFPEFEGKILSGEKKHSFRRDPKKRWRRGMSIQHWMGSPRNTKSAKKPRHFADDVCKDVQDVVIEWVHDKLELTIYDKANLPPVKITSQEAVLIIARNDGFSSVVEMANYFCPEGEPWEGRIIHFTNFCK